MASRSLLILNLYILHVKSMFKLQVFDRTAHRFVQALFRNVDSVLVFFYKNNLNFFWLSFSVKWTHVLMEESV